MLRFSFEEGDQGAPKNVEIAKTSKYSTVVIPPGLKQPTAVKGSAPKKIEQPLKTKPAPATTPVSAEPPTSTLSPEQVASIEKEIEAQGAEVVKLKGEKVDEAILKKAVEKLLELKNKLPEDHPVRVAANQSRKDKKKGGATTTAAAVASGPEDHKAKKGERAEAANEEVEKEKLAQLKSVKTDRYGMMDMVTSRVEDKQNKKWTLVGDLNPSLVGQTVLIRGYAHVIKSPASATFVVVRQRMHTVQCVVDASEVDFKSYVDKIPVESILDVTGEVVSAEVKSTTISNVEIKVKTLFVVQPARVRLPFQPREAERPPPPEDSEEALDKKKTKNILQDVRLNHRTLDLRTPAMQAIARISDGVIRYFSEYLRSLGFVEIMTPKLLAGASEGGADVFKTNYFGQTATLAQSPQLHKQMCAACSGFERVFEIGPVFRAENSRTNRHLTEFHGLDLEMAIYEHYHEALEVFSNLFYYIFDKLNENHKSELEVIRLFSPFEDIKYRIPGKDRALILTFEEGIAMLEEDLKKNGEPATQEEKDTAKNGFVTWEDIANMKKYVKESDPTTPVEKRLGFLVKEKYGVDFYMLDKYPLACRPFYTMPDPTNDQHPERKASNSYDMFIRGQEILSGAQRVHDAKMLEDLVIAKGIPVESLKFYIDAFKDGALPHAGGGIGLERVVMLFLGIPTIRWAALFTRDPSRLIP